MAVLSSVELVIANSSACVGDHQLPLLVVTKIDPADLLDASEVAELLGLSSAGAVSVYRARYDDFPAPAVRKASGKCVLWLRADIAAWADERRQ
jgi:predicted DNA-binding transcriptional regulator AlpA